MREINPNSHFTVDPLVCDGCKSEFYHLVMNEEQPTRQWCMWCFGRAFGVSAMESQSLYYKKKDVSEAGIPMTLLWEFPTEYFEGYEAKPISKITLEDFNLLNRKDNKIEGMVK